MTKHADGFRRVIPGTGSEFRPTFHLFLKVGHSFAADIGIPVAAGLIVGEALVGVGFALAAVFGGA